MPDGNACFDDVSLPGSKSPPSPPRTGQVGWFQNFIRISLMKVWYVSMYKYAIYTYFTEISSYIIHTYETRFACYGYYVHIFLITHIRLIFCCGTFVCCCLLITFQVVSISQDQPQESPIWKGYLDQMTFK